MKIYHKTLFTMVRTLIGLHRVMFYFKFHHEFDNGCLSNKNTFTTLLFKQSTSTQKVI